MSDLEELISRFIEDHNSLSNDEEERLVLALRESPELARRVKEQLLMNELISQRFALDRQDFTAQIQQRVRDYEAGDDALAEQVVSLRSIAEEELDLWNARSERVRFQKFLAGMAAALVVLAAAGAWYWLSNRMQSVAVVETVIGGGNLTRKQETRVIRPGETVAIGDRLETAAGQMIALRYQDGTRVELAGDTIVRLPEEGPNHAKKLLVLRGDVSADVAHQQADRRMTFESMFAAASVIGTKLTFSVREDATWLDVTEGKVAFSRFRVDATPLVISANQFGVATHDRILAARSAWPSDRQGVVFQFQSQLGPNLAWDVTTQTLRRTELAKVGEVGFDDHGVLKLDGGRFVGVNVENGIVHACRASGQFTLEANILPRDLRQPGLPRIIALSSGEHSFNLLLCQRDDQLVARVRTTGKESVEEVPLCRLSLGEPNHVLMTYQTGALKCYHNGDLTAETSSVTGTLENWAGQKLSLGSEVDGTHPWRGLLEGVALYDRCLDRQEAAKNAAAYRVLQRDRTARQRS